MPLHTRGPEYVDGAHVLTSTVRTLSWHGDIDGHRTEHEVTVTLQYFEGRNIVMYHVSTYGRHHDQRTEQGSFQMERELGAPAESAQHVWAAYVSLQKDPLELAF